MWHSFFWYHMDDVLEFLVLVVFAVVAFFLLRNVKVPEKWQAFYKPALKLFCVGIVLIGLLILID